MNVKNMVEEFLDLYDYEGLFNDIAECACDRDNLFPCGSKGVENCRPGYKVKCDPNDVHGFDWMILEEVVKCHFCGENIDPSGLYGRDKSEGEEGGLAHYGCIPDEILEQE